MRGPRVNPSTGGKNQGGGLHSNIIFFKVFDLIRSIDVGPVHAEHQLQMVVQSHGLRLRPPLRSFLGMPAAVLGHARSLCGGLLTEN